VLESGGSLPGRGLVEPVEADAAMGYNSVFYVRKPRLHLMPRNERPSIEQAGQQGQGGPVLRTSFSGSCLDQDGLQRLNDPSMALKLLLPPRRHPLTARQRQVPSVGAKRPDIHHKDISATSSPLR